MVCTLTTSATRAERPVGQRDAVVQQDVVHLAAEQVVALGPAGQLLAGDEPGGEPAGDVEHAEGGDEGRQLEADGDDGVDQAGGHAGEQAHRHRGERDRRRAP